MTNKPEIGLSEAVTASQATSKTGTGADRQAWQEGPFKDSHCDTCGKRMPLLTPKRGDKRRYCSAECRQRWRSMETSAGRFLLRRTIEARLFKHADPGRADQARSEIANYIADLLRSIDMEREHMRAIEPEAGIITTKEIRAELNR